MPPIHYRPIDKRDYSKVADLLKTTFHYNQLAGEWNAKCMSYTFMYSCLAEHTFAQVAEADGKIIGIVVGKGEEVPLSSTLLNWKLYSHYFLLLFTNEGKEIALSFRRNKQAEDALYNQVKEPFNGKMILLAVHPDYQHSSIGTHLFDLFIAYLKEQKAKHFFLFTDNRLNYRFYERREMQRKAVISRYMPLYKQTVNFFLYSGKVTHES